MFEATGLYVNEPITNYRRKQSLRIDDCIHAMLSVYSLKNICYKGSAWVSAFAGTHASGRAGQHFELFDSVLLEE